jgi:hypothetical protein
MIYKPHFEKISTDPYEEIQRILEKYTDAQKIAIIEKLGKKLRQKNSIRISKLK